MTYIDMKDQIERCGVHPLLGPTGEDNLGIEQNPHELATFLTAIESEIQTVLEIGTGYRAGLATFMHTVLGWQVTSVDVQDYQHTQPGIEFLITADPKTLPRALEGRSFDLVIIDGNHAYESVKRDHALYGPLGRIVMFHDIAGLRDCEGAARYWMEISRTARSTLRKGYDEVIADGATAAGIGWVRHA